MSVFFTAFIVPCVTSIWSKLTGSKENHVEIKKSSGTKVKIEKIRRFRSNCCITVQTPPRETKTIDSIIRNVSHISDII